MFLISLRTYLSPVVLLGPPFGRLPFNQLRTMNENRRNSIGLQQFPRRLVAHHFCVHVHLKAFRLEVVFTHQSRFGIFVGFDIEFVRPNIIKPFSTSFPVRQWIWNREKTLLCH